MSNELRKNIDAPKAHSHYPNSCLTCVHKVCSLALCSRKTQHKGSLTCLGAEATEAAKVKMCGRRWHNAYQVSREEMKQYPTDGKDDRDIRVMESPTPTGAPRNRPLEDITVCSTSGTRLLPP